MVMIAFLFLVNKNTNGGFLFLFLHFFPFSSPVASLASIASAIAPAIASAIAIAPAIVGGINLRMVTIALGFYSYFNNFIFQTVFIITVVTTNATEIQIKAITIKAMAQRSKSENK